MRQRIKEQVSKKWAVILLIDWARIMAAFAICLFMALAFVWLLGAASGCAKPHNFGGNMHTENIYHWHAAPYPNRLQTAAYWVQTVPAVKARLAAIHYWPRKVSTIRQAAQALTSCMDDTITLGLLTDPLPAYQWSHEVAGYCAQIIWAAPASTPVPRPQVKQ